MGIKKNEVAKLGKLMVAMEIGLTKPVDVKLLTKASKNFGSYLKNLCEKYTESEFEKIELPPDFFSFFSNRFRVNAFKGVMEGLTNEWEDYQDGY